MTAELHYPKRVATRLLLLVPLVVGLICIVVARTHIASVGSTYDHVIDDFAGQHISADNVSIQPSDMARVVSTKMNPDGSTTVTFEALSDGRGSASVTMAEGGMSFSLDVREGVVYAESFNFSGWRSILIGLVVVMTLAAVVCAIAFAMMLRDAWFSHEMAAYAGAGLFFVVQALIFGSIWTNEGVHTFGELALQIVNSAQSFVELLAPPFFIVTILVAASNFVLMRREGRNLKNALGIVLGLAGAVLALTWRSLAEFAEAQIKLSDAFVWWFAGLLFGMALAFALALFFGAMITALLAAAHTPSAPRDYIAILGCALMPDGSLTPLLRGRVDAARSFARAQCDQGMSHPVLVPSGGQGSDERTSEAEAMGAYLAEVGETCRVVLEDRATNTHENLLFAREVIEKDAQSQGRALADLKLAFSTTNYHVLRGYVCAHKAGIAAEGIAAPTKLYFWPNALLREFVGLLAARLWPILVAFVCVEALYALALYITMLGGAA